MAGAQDRRIALIGEMGEKQIGPKNIKNVTNSMAKRVILSFNVFGGVRKIFFMSISNG